MGKLEGKVALVTGSGRNIGRATVLKLADEGAHVVVNARSNRQEAEAVAREARDLGVKAVPVLADVGKKAEVETLAAKALSEFGRVDILINNAAIRPHKPFTETTDADWELVRSVVLDGPLYLTRALIEPNGQKSLRAHSVLRRRRRDFRSRQRSRSFICSQDGVDRHGARARLRIRAA
jgi:3-oxoacyl-[acyl-carrier protein] reductase